MTLYSNTTFQANTNILYDDAYQIVIDYSGYLERIATAVENCAANLSSIKTSVSNISSNVSSISTNFTYVTGNVYTQALAVSNISSNMVTQTTAINSAAANLNSIRSLGSNSGFRTTTPDGILGLATTYRYLVVEGLAANTEETANAAVQEIAKQNIATDANAALTFLSTLPPLTY